MSPPRDRSAAPPTSPSAAKAPAGVSARQRGARPRGTASAAQRPAAAERCRAGAGAAPRRSSPPSGLTRRRTAPPVRLAESSGPRRSRAPQRDAQQRRAAERRRRPRDARPGSRDPLEPPRAPPRTRTLPPRGATRRSGRSGAAARTWESPARAPPAAPRTGRARRTWPRPRAGATPRAVARAGLRLRARRPRLRRDPLGRAVRHRRGPVAHAPGARAVRGRRRSSCRAAAVTTGAAGIAVSELVPHLQAERRLDARRRRRGRPRSGVKRTSPAARRGAGARGSRRSPPRPTRGDHRLLAPAEPRAHREPRRRPRPGRAGSGRESSPPSHRELERSARHRVAGRVEDPRRHGGRLARAPATSASRSNATATVRGRTGDGLDAQDGARGGRAGEPDREPLLAGRAGRQRPERLEGARLARPPRDAPARRLEGRHVAAPRRAVRRDHVREHPHLLGRRRPHLRAVGDGVDERRLRHRAGRPAGSRGAPRARRAARRPGSPRPRSRRRGSGRRCARRRGA